MVTIIGFGARALLGQGADGGRRQGRQPRGAAAGAVRSAAARAPSGGDIALALFSAAAFATILAVVAGLVIASAGAIAHDLWTNVLGRGTEETASARSRGSPRSASAWPRSSARWRSAPASTSPCSSAWRSCSRPARTSRRCCWRCSWRRFNTAGALTGIAFGITASVDHDRAQPAGVAGPGLAGLAVAADVPGPRDDPDRLLRLLARHDAQHAREEATERTYDELLVRSETGIGSEGADPRRPSRREREHATATA